MRRTDEGNGGGRRGSEAVVGKANRIASAAGSPHYQCKPFMQILRRCLSGPCSSKSGALKHTPVRECNLHRLSCLNMGQREKRRVGGKDENGEGVK